MERQLELAALGLGVTGWFCTIVVRCLPLWTVSGTVDNITATLPAYWDGVWLEWDHWDLNHDGSLHCSFYQSLMSLSGNFRTWRALLMAAIGTGAFAAVVSVVGAVFFPKRAHVKVASGAVFILSGILQLVPVAWTCHHTKQPLGGAVALRRDWGAALYLGWVSFALMMTGGAFLCTRCRPVQEQEVSREPAYPTQEHEAQSPLNMIHRTTFTASQYGRGAQPIYSSPQSRGL
ncbi:claudin-3-like [Aplochiton taeniatus]